MTVQDFTETEQKLVSALLLKRYARLILPQWQTVSYSYVHSDELTLCPTLYWNGRGAQFVVCKIAADRYRSQFFYSDTEQYGTGRAEYDDLNDCVVTLLQVQSDHERQLADISARATQADTDTDYHGPVVI